MRRAIALLILAALSATASAEPGATKNGNRPSVLRVSSDGRALEIQRPADSAIQRVDVLTRCGAPAVGEPRIREIKDRGALISVTFGKHCFAEVALTDLHVRCTGCD